MKRIILLFGLILTFAMLKAQEVYRFRTEAPQGFSVKNSTASQLSLHFSIQELGIANIENGDVKGHEIILKGQFAPNAEGLPNLPFENCYIAIPQGASVNIAVKENGSRTLRDIDLLPSAKIQGNTAIGLPKLHKNMSVFGKDADFPINNVTVAQRTQIRGLDVVLLSVTPFRYNPVRKTLEIIHDIDITVSFEGGNGQFGETRYRNPAWDNIMRNLVVNSDVLPEAHYYERLNEAIRNGEEGCEYLIITPDDDSIAAWADTLCRFRNRQGILTKVVNVNECGGNDTQAIKGYIRYAFDNWAIPPAAVLLFGSVVDTIIHYSPVQHSEESSGIPGFPLVFKGYNNGYTTLNYNYISDNPYADINGDTIPDIVISRLSAVRQEDYRTQVNKLIEYETYPPTDSGYYDRPIITSGHEDNKWFLITSQSVNNFFRSKLGKHPYNFYMLYDYTSFENPDSVWSTAYNTACVVDYFGPNGQNYIAQYPDTLNNWRTMRDNSYFVDALNRSSFLTLYRDHCAVDLWCCPEFESNEIASLNNTWPTFILSIGCNTAHYSLTIMGNGYWYDPVLHTFCNNPVGGIGGIGATTVTHTLYNDMLTWGFIDYVWPEFMPNLGSHSAPDYVRPAYGLVAGKLFLHQYAFMPNWWPQRINDTHNVFHYLGEAYFNLFTEVPKPLVIDAPSYHTNNQWEYTFTAEEGSTVCLSKNGQIISVLTATGQPQSITLPALSCDEQYLLTATKQNRNRFEQPITVISTLQNQWASTTFKVFPNPTDGKVNLDLGRELCGKAVIEVYNSLGEKLLTTHIPDLRNSGTMSLDLSHFATGLYTIKLCTENGSCSKKVCIR